MLFTDPHIVYSPSTLNVFYKLKELFKTQLISARQSNYYTDKEIVDDNITYIDFAPANSIYDLIKGLFFRITDKFFKPSASKITARTLNNSKTRALIAYIKKTDKEIIAVDFMALWCVQQVGKQAHLLSLEINQNDPYYQNIKLSTIKSVIIQSKERLDYLFPSEKPKYFIVQNAPKNIDFVPVYNQREKTNLLYCGSAVFGFGIISCLDFIKDYKEYTLTVKGAFPKDTEQVINEFYADLLAEKRLIVDNEYLSETELTHFVSKFRIGFAFYDFYRFGHLKTFNYFTAPSGKVFQYLNSGVPVIGNKLQGFDFIEEKKCGKLIGYLSSLQIKSAIDAIENDYLTYAANAKKAALTYDFNTMIQPFLDYVVA